MVDGIVHNQLMVDNGVVDRIELQLVTNNGPGIYQLLDLMA